jgi:hypothetical protein
MNQYPYIAASTLAVENIRFLSTDSYVPQDPNFTGISQWRRGGIARGCAARPPLALRTTVADAPVSSLPAYLLE